MKKPAKVMRSEARMIEGRPCIVLIGKDGIGRPVEIAVPEEGLQALFADASQRLLAQRSAQAEEERGRYSFLHTQRGTPAEIGRMTTEDGEEVVLRARKGTPLETILRFSAHDAKALANEILSTVGGIDAEAEHAPRPN